MLLFEFCWKISCWHESNQFNVVSNHSKNLWTPVYKASTAHYIILKSQNLRWHSTQKLICLPPKTGLQQLQNYQTSMLGTHLCRVGLSLSLDAPCIFTVNKSQKEHFSIPILYTYSLEGPVMQTMRAGSIMITAHISTANTKQGINSNYLYNINLFPVLQIVS